MPTAKCIKCEGELQSKGHGGNCKHCGVSYCKECWNVGTYWCKVCGKEL